MDFKKVWKTKPWAYVHRFSATDVAVYDLSKGNVSYRLNLVAAQIFLLVDGVRSFREILECIRANADLEYDELCELADRLLSDLEKKNLIEPRLVGSID